MSRKLRLLLVMWAWTSGWIIVNHDAAAQVTPLPTSCHDALVHGATTDGVHTIDPDGAGGAEAVDVYCDLTTDGGGWTLVASTRDSTLNDLATGYYDDLATLSPASGNAGVWDGMRGAAAHPLTDVRFSCRDELYSGSFTVDLVFYDVPWYGTITTSGLDDDSCFETESNHVSPPPARRDLVAARFLPVGDPWSAGTLIGEDGCSSDDDFTVDFDDRGMDSDQNDGTDWGEDDGAGKCGRSGIAGGTWFVWVREPRGVFLSPSEMKGGAAPGNTATYTFTVLNLTGDNANFTLSVSGNAWSAVVVPPTVGPLAEGESALVDVQVAIPPDAIPRSSDQAFLNVASDANPLMKSLSTLTTTALSGQFGYTFNAEMERINVVDTGLHIDTGMDILTDSYGSYPWRGALSPDGRRLYASLRNSDNVLVIDTATRGILASIPVDDGPHGIAFSPNGSRAFVVNSYENTVSVIDTSALSVVQTLNLENGGHPMSVATSPCLGKVFVTNQYLHTVSVIQEVADGFAVTNTIGGFNAPWDIVVSPYGHLAYVTNSNEPGIGVIDTVAETVVATWYLPTSGRLAGLDVSPDGSKLYVPHHSDDVVYVVDAFTGDILAAPPRNKGLAWEVECFPEGEGPVAYVSSLEDDGVNVIDTGADTQKTFVPITGGARGLALFPPETSCLRGVLLSPPKSLQYGQGGGSAQFALTVFNLTGANGSFDITVSGNQWNTVSSITNTGDIPNLGSLPFVATVDIPPGTPPAAFDVAAITAVSTLDPSFTDSAELTTAVPKPGYVFNPEEDAIEVVDTRFHARTGIVIDTSQDGSYPWRGAISPDGTRLFASLRDSDRILVVDTATNSSLGSIPVGHEPHGIAFSADGAFAFVANQDSASVTVIDVPGLSVVQTIPVGDRPMSVATSPCLDKVYVTCQDDDTLVIIDMKTMTLVGNVPDLDEPWDVVIAPTGNRAYVTNRGDGTIRVIDTATNTVEDAWFTGARDLAGCDIAPDGKTLYVVDHSGPDTTYVLDTKTGSIMARIPSGDSLWEAEAFPLGQGPYVYVSAVGSNAVSVIDRSTNAVVVSIPIPGRPRGLALFPPETECYQSPVAAFSPFTTAVTVGSSVTFTNLTTGSEPLSFSWDFGDGAPPTTVKDPVHAYPNVDTYPVSLTASNPFGEDTATGSVTTYEPVVAAFIPQSITIKVGESVSFTNQTKGTGPLRFIWLFGDGSPLSVDEDPSHTFNKAGTFAVTLLARSPYDHDYTNGTVTVCEPAKAAFQAVPSPAPTGGTVVFVNSSTGSGPLSYQWDFGDGTAGSTEMHPTHVYAAKGDYTVTLTTTGPCDSSTAKNTLSVYVAFQASFTPTTIAIPVGGSVSFTNSSTGDGILRYLWFFGDVSLPTLAKDPTHTYTRPGVFTVRLYVERSLDAASAEGIVTVYEPAAAAFAPDAAVITPGGAVQFENLSTGTGPLTCSWDFGDGSPPVNNDCNPTHAYAAHGQYTVTLTVTGPYGTDQTTGKVNVRLFVGYLALARED